MTRDVGDHGDFDPLPLPPVSPNFTQGHPMSPKPGVPGKPGFGLLGWKVTQTSLWSAAALGCGGHSAASLSANAICLLSKNSSLLALRHSHHSAFPQANKVRNSAPARQCQIIPDKSAQRPGINS